MTYTAAPCPCGQKSCNDWHVRGVAQVQGVHFTKAQAEAVANLLNEMAEREELQQLLNTAVRGVVTQGKLARLEGPRRVCYYAGDDGSRCAVGHILNDEQIAKVKEMGLNADAGVGRINEVLEMFPRGSRQLALLSDLQVAHDEAESIDDFIEGARKIACRYDLEIAV